MLKYMAMDWTAEISVFEHWWGKDSYFYVVHTDFVNHGTTYPMGTREDFFFQQ
jgi:hypothetical protein